MSLKYLNSRWNGLLFQSALATVKSTIEQYATWRHWEIVRERERELMRIRDWEREGLAGGGLSVIPLTCVKFWNFPLFWFPNCFFKLLVETWICFKKRFNFFRSKNISKKIARYRFVSLSFAQYCWKVF